MTAPSTKTAPTVLESLGYLTSYNANAAVRAAAELTRAVGTAWVDALTRATTPVEMATRGLMWVNAMNDRREPRWHRANEIVFSTPFAHLRDFSTPDTDVEVVPTLVLPPQAGHSSHVVDFSPVQSQLDVIAAAGLTRVYALEWRPATTATRDVSITDYLQVIDRSIRRMGGRANIVGDCQGGWLAAIYAALYPERVHTLTLAGAPIDFHAGDVNAAAYAAKRPDGKVIVAILNKEAKQNLQIDSPIFDTVQVLSGPALDAHEAHVNTVVSESSSRRSTNGQRFILPAHTATLIVLA